MSKNGLCRAILELFLPRRACCMGCGDRFGLERSDLCETCRRLLAERFIGLRMPPKHTGLSGAAYAYPYNGPAGGVVRNLKYRGVRLLAERMGADIARAAELLRPEGDVLVTYVPMHPRRLRRLGFNHAELLARELAVRLALPCADLLMRTRNAPRQTRLKREQRLVNLKDAFRAVPEQEQQIRGRTILLVDDVWTTGATAASCTKALKDAGAARVYFVGYAYGERK